LAVGPLRRARRSFGVQGDEVRPGDVEVIEELLDPSLRLGEESVTESVLVLLNRQTSSSSRTDGLRSSTL